MTGRHCPILSRFPEQASRLLPVKPLLSANRTGCFPEPVNVGKFQTTMAPDTLELVGVKKNITFDQRHPDFIVQQVAPGTFIHLKSGIDEHQRMDGRKCNDFAMYFVMKQFLSGQCILLKGLRFYEKTLPLLEVLFIAATAATICIRMPGHRFRFDGR